MKLFAFVVTLFFSCIPIVVNAADLSLPDLNFRQIRVINQRLPQNAINVPFVRFSITPKTNTKISEIQVRQTGLSTSKDIDKVFAILGGRRSSKSSVGAKGLALIRFIPALKLEANTKYTGEIQAHLHSQNGRSIGFKMEKILDGK